MHKPPVSKTGGFVLSIASKFNVTQKTCGMPEAAEIPIFCASTHGFVPHFLQKHFQKHVLGVIFCHPFPRDTTCRTNLRRVYNA
jgi:hypothetical protein